MQTKQRNDRSTKNKSQKTIDVDSVEHQTGRDSTFVQQKQQNAENAKREAITKRCVD